MRNPGIIGVAFIVIADRLARMGQEYRVPVRSARLDAAHTKILFCDGVRMFGSRSLVLGVIQSEVPAFQSAVCLAQLVAETYRCPR